MRVDTMLKVTMSTVDGHNSTTLGSRTPSPQYKVGGDDGQTKTTTKKYIAGAINFVLGGGESMQVLLYYGRQPSNE